MSDGPVLHRLGDGSSLRVALDDAPERVDVDFLELRINAFNIGRTGHDDGRELAVWLRDGDGALVGGLYGWTWGRWLEVAYLWLREDLRGRGIGRDLLGRAEEEAVRRGCAWVFLDSYSFQAPGFYEALGYEQFGVLDDYPTGHRRHFFRKSLASAAPDHAGE